MPASRYIKLALALPFVLAGALCSSDSSGPSGGDDALVFANSSSYEVNVDLTLPGGVETDLTLPASSTGGETRVDVSFVEGHVYSVLVWHDSPSIAPSLRINCTVSAAAERDGVAAILVYTNVSLGALVAQCLTNWEEST